MNNKKHSDAAFAFGNMKNTVRLCPPQPVSGRRMIEVTDENGEIKIMLPFKQTILNTAAAAAATITAVLACGTVIFKLATALIKARRTKK